MDLHKAEMLWKCDVPGSSVKVLALGDSVLHMHSHSFCQLSCSAMQCTWLFAHAGAAYRPLPSHRDRGCNRALLQLLTSSQLKAVSRPVKWVHRGAHAGSLALASMG